MIQRRSVSSLLIMFGLFIASATYAQERRLQSAAADTQATTISFQGQLTESGNPANSTYDMQFKLFDNPTVGTGTQQGPTVTNPTVVVSNGSFIVALDFGSAVFDGSARYLEIGVRPAGSPNPYTVLSPRDPVYSAPYALRSLNATSADGLSVACISCVTSGQIVSVNGSSVTGTIPVASVPDLGASYIKNSTSAQASANFNIAGNGTLGGTLSGNTINTQTQYNLGGQRMLSNPGINNLFAGVSAGAANTTGCCNTFFGFHAGAVSNANDNSFFGNNAGAGTTGGNRNSFFGSGAGFSNVNGVGNSFFGVSAGQNNIANSNSFFGDSAGFSNATGAANSFFGNSAGFLNTAGVNNSFFGFQAGRSNTGDNNSFFGVNAGFSNTASSNSFFGYRAGFNNTVQVGNTFIGYNAGLNNGAEGNLQSGFANTFVGSSAGEGNTIGVNNTFVGYQAGLSNTQGFNNSFYGFFTGGSNLTGISNSFFGSQAGNANTSGRSNSFFGEGAGVSNTIGNSNSFYGVDSGARNINGGNNSFFGNAAGLNNTNGGLNSFYGAGAGSNNTTGTNNSVLGANADVNVNNLTFATAIGAGTRVVTSNTIVLGRDFLEDVIVGNHLRVQSIPPLPSGAAVCFNFAGDLLQCGASSLRWKKNVHSFNAGLDIIRKLRPISFSWKESGLADIGLAAEEVARVAPSFTFTDGQGEIAGVKYERLNIVLINAINQQQAEIEQEKSTTQQQQKHLVQQQLQIKRQQTQITRQQNEIDELKELLCRDHPQARICKADQKR